MMLPPPPPPLRAGQRLVAGLGHATVLPDLDFETYSEAGFCWDGEKWHGPPGAPQNKKGLPVVGVAVYATHPSTEVLTLSYDLKDGHGVRRWMPGEPLPTDLLDHVRFDNLIESHNAGFEWWIWNHVCVPRYGWPALDVMQQRCSAAKARAHGLPGALGNLLSVLGGPNQKNKEGESLIKLFSMPQKPTKVNGGKLRITPADAPEQFERFRAYCDDDIRAEGRASGLCPDLSPEELRWWQVDQLINRRGVAVDMAAVRGCVAILDEALARGDAELYALTGGTVARASELAKLSGWLGAQGVHMRAMDEEAIGEALERPGMPPHARRALEIRAMIGSASVKKVYAIANQATEAGRLHELFMWHEAHTGRAAGKGPQPTNLPNSGPAMRRCGCGKHYGTGKAVCPWCGGTGGTVVEWGPEAAEDLIPVLTCGSLDYLLAFVDDALAAMGGCLRGLFVAAEGHDLIGSDYSSIEAVVLACLAGEQWRIDLFRSGGKIYESSASKITGTPVEEMARYKAETGNHHPDRKLGKVAELGGGYGGWIGAWKGFGADEFMSDEEIVTAIKAWRAASPAIVEFWGGQYRGAPWAEPRQVEYFGLEGAAIQAVLRPGETFSHRGIGYQVHADVLYCTLLSGRRIAYHRPRLRSNERDRWGQSYALSFEGWNSNPKKGPMGWTRMDLYGGLLTNNVVQATARDILAHAVVRLWDAGYHTVLHVYDEAVAEIPKGWGSVEEFERILEQLPAWCADWPVRARGGWRAPRFRK